ncbi:glyoxalase-like domain-containing protein [Hypoxylon fuscum]|nr:glyoxalase-like domain-containing protein [Hypoxylon fuscum]
MSTSTSTTPLVDHIVILIPHSFLTAPPRWFADLFRLYPGGRHADGRTENALALLADGSYLEFIAFVPGADRAPHHWGAKHEGSVVDWAVTLPPSPSLSEGVEGAELPQENTFRDIQRRVRDKHAGIVYADLVRGGRTRPDGEVIKWGVAFLKREEGSDADAGPVEAGTVPFWCLDVTPRRLRVPYEHNDDGASDFTKHPTDVVGVADIEVLAQSGAVAESAKGVYDVLLGERDGGDGGWKIGSPAGEKVHSGGAVRLGTSGEGAWRTNITFFTDDERLVGTEVGGKVDDKHTLTFKLVAAFPK